MLDSKGWHSRGYLPHFDRPNLIQAITFRLYDSMPQTVLDRWEAELPIIPDTQREAERQKRIAAHLDAGYGACWLRNQRVAKIVEDSFLHFDGERYRLIAWVIMPNHVHLLVELLEGWAMDKLIKSWKNWTAKKANEVLGRSGTFWGRDYYDRYIRDGEHFEFARNYIHENPVKARLCQTKEDWPWSSAARER